MTPIRKLLNRIRWDRNFGSAEFRIGYFDRHLEGLQFVGLKEMHFPDEADELFEVIDPDDQIRRIPLHRIREVYRNEELIWQRAV